MKVMFGSLGSGVAVLVLSVALAACSSTTEPFSPQELADKAKADQQKMFADQEPVAGPVTLYEAMARAVIYNLEHRLKLMENAIAIEDAKVARYDLLPRLTQSAGYTARNNDSASNSKNLATGVVDPEFSSSSEKSFETANLSMAWNVLDFGVSWFRARQQSDSVWAAEERRRKVVQNILQDVRFAFWRAYGAQRLLPKVDALLGVVKEALVQAREVERRGLQQAQALEYQVQLLDTVRQINAIKRDLVLARAELAALMNLPPATSFELAAPPEYSVPQVKEPLEKLQRAALFLRPEIREQRYQERITVAETTKTILRLLPGIEVNVDRQYTGNSFTYHQNWIEGGLKLTWNLMSLVGAGDKIALAEAREDLVRRQQQALGVAVLTQVNVGWLRYRQSLEDFSVVDELYGAASRLEEHGARTRLAAAESGLEVIRRSSRAMYVELQRDTAYAELQNAAGRLFGSVGLDPVIATDKTWTLAQLSTDIRAQIERWDQGNLAIPEEIEATPTAIESEPALRQATDVGPRNIPQDIAAWFRENVH